MVKTYLTKKLELKVLSYANFQQNSVNFLCVCGETSSIFVLQYLKKIFSQETLDFLILCYNQVA